MYISSKQSKSIVIESSSMCFHPPKKSVIYLFIFRFHRIEHIIFKEYCFFIFIVAIGEIQYHIFYLITIFLLIELILKCPKLQV